MKRTHGKMSMDDFSKTRQVVLQQWPTGKEVHFEEAVLYQKRLPQAKVFSRALENAHSQKKTLLQPRAGVALVADHKELLRFLEEEGEADLLPTTVDSYTRHNRFQKESHPFCAYWIIISRRWMA